MSLKFGVVIPTLRRPETIALLLDSIHTQEVNIHQVVIVDQSGDPHIPEWLKPYQSLSEIRIIERTPGVAAARNAGVEALLDVDIVATADDDVWYEPGAFTAAETHIQAGADIVSGRLCVGDHEDSRWQFAKKPMTVDRKNVWTAAIETTLFYRHDVYQCLGGMDEALGLGSGTAWGSGEATELLIRALKENKTIVYDPAIMVTERPLQGLTQKQLVQRKRSYARGTGRVAGMHPDAREIVKIVAGPALRATKSAAKRDWQQAHEHLQVELGRLEGLTKVVV